MYSIKRKLDLTYYTCTCKNIRHQISFDSLCFTKFQGQNHGQQSFNYRYSIKISQIHTKTNLMSASTERHG